MLRARGITGSYQWVTTLEGVAALLQRGSVLFGVPWYNAWFEPDSDGFVDAGGPDRWESSVWPLLATLLQALNAFVLHWSDDRTAAMNAAIACLGSAGRLVLRP
jgi:hypothetical protein